MHKKKKKGKHGKCCQKSALIVLIRVALANWRVWSAPRERETCFVTDHGPLEAANSGWHATPLTKRVVRIRTKIALSLSIETSLPG